MNLELIVAWVEGVGGDNKRIRYIGIPNSFILTNFLHFYILFGKLRRRGVACAVSEP